MITELSVLNGSGDQRITWDHADPDQVAEARNTVADLAKAGYSFFLTDGTPADEVSAGQGTLIVRKLTAKELTEPPAPESDSADEPAPTEAATEQAEQKKGRGRPRKAIAVRPMTGGAQ